MLQNKGSKGYRYVEIVMMAVLLLFVARLFLVAGTMVSSNEGKKTAAENILDGIEGLTQSAVKQLIPVLNTTHWDKENKSGIKMAGIKEFISSEILPFGSYIDDYEAPAVAMVSNMDQVPIYFYEDEVTESHEPQEEVQAVTTTTNKKNPKPEKTQYSLKQLSDFNFLVKNFYTVDSTAKVIKSELNAKKLLNKNMHINLDGQEPKILIYHSHTSEDFIDSRPGRSSDTILGVGTVLAKELEDKYGIPVYHDKTVYDIIDGKLDRNKAYSMSLNGIEKILKAHPSIEVVIDLHRDGVGKDTRLVTNINGKETAQIMFFNGVSRTAMNGDIGYLKNPNKEGNLAFSLQLQLAAASKYPGYTRRIYIKGYRYNLHVKPRSLLVETGANTNTVGEAKNAMYPLADILNDVLRENSSQ